MTHTGTVHMLHEFVALVLVTVAMRSQPAPARLPAALLAETARDPAGFTRVLADLLIPAGLEIRETDVRARLLPRTELDLKATVDAADVVVAFNRAHPDYEAALLDGVFVIRPTKRLPDYLDQPARTDQFTCQGLMRGAKKVFAALDPRLVSDGEIGSILGQPGVEIDHGENTTISVDGRGVTNLAALNQIARQAPGHPWLVVVSQSDRAPRIVSLGFIHRFDTSTEVSLTQP
jgi:hypothetical protein